MIHVYGCTPKLSGGADARVCVRCSLLLRVGELHPSVSVQDGPGGAVVCRNALAWAPIGT